MIFFSPPRDVIEQRSQKIEKQHFAEFGCGEPCPAGEVRLLLEDVPVRRAEVAREQFVHDRLYLAALFLAAHSRTLEKLRAIFG